MLRKHVVVPLDFDLPRRPRRAPRRTPPVHAVCQRVLHLTLHLNHPVQEDVLELVGLRAHTNSGCVGKKKKLLGAAGAPHTACRSRRRQRFPHASKLELSH